MSQKSAFTTATLYEVPKLWPEGNAFQRPVLMRCYFRGDFGEEAPGIVPAESAEEAVRVALR